MPLNLCALNSPHGPTPDPSDVQHDHPSFDHAAQPSFDIAACLSELARRNLDAIAADLEQGADDPDGCERRARALATVTLALDDIERARTQRAAPVAPVEWVVDENDPRACPREPHMLRTHLADALDRLAEKKNISFI